MGASGYHSGGLGRDKMEDRMNATTVAVPCPRHGLPIQNCVWCEADRAYLRITKQA
jgi:hypothetical protein